MDFNLKMLKDEYIELDRKTLARKQEILDQFKSNNLLIVHDHIVPNSNLCIFLSCPGEQEFINNKVCAGETGENLDKILFKVLNEIPNINPQTQQCNDTAQVRYKYSIINSVETVHIERYNNSEADDDDITKEDNVQRAIKNIRKISNIDYVIVCGTKADLLFNELKNQEIFSNKIKYTIVKHLGWRSLRMYYNNEHPDIKKLAEASERDEKRLELVAKEIINNFKKT